MVHNLQGQTGSYGPVTSAAEANGRLYFGIHRPISARLSVTFWKGFGGSPITFSHDKCPNARPTDAGEPANVAQQLGRTIGV